jgi:presenilin-like A22 family membrane protease
MDKLTCLICFEDCNQYIKDFSNLTKCDCNFIIHHNCYNRLISETKIYCIFCRTPVKNTKRQLNNDNIYKFSYVIPIVVFILHIIINYFFDNIHIVLKYIFIAGYVCYCILNYSIANNLNKFVNAINFRHGSDLLDQIR